MKAIILAAGVGSRLHPFTENKPKCMVSFQGKPIIHYILDAMNKNNLKDIGIITGYKKDVLKQYIKENYDYKEISLYHNPVYDKTNMVYTLFCAKDFFEGDHDVVISYSDIIYKQEILNQVIEGEGDICVVVDKAWRKLWEKRMENPLEDAETMKLDEYGYIKELGKKPKSYEDIEGQYIGLIKFSKEVTQQVIDFYYALDKEKTYDGKDFQNMYMTTFVQLLINHGFKVKPVQISGGWVEIDSVNDLENLHDYEL